MYFHCGFFCDSQIHEGHCGISMLGCNYFVQKRCWCITFTGQQVGVIYGVWVAHADPSGGQTYPFFVSLDALLCLLSSKVAHVGVLWSISCWHSFLFFSSFFSLSLRENAPLSFYFFIVYCRPWFYYKSFSCF